MRPTNDPIHTTSFRLSRPLFLPLHWCGFSAPTARRFRLRPFLPLSARQSLLGPIFSDFAEPQPHAGRCSTQAVLTARSSRQCAASNGEKQRYARAGIASAQLNGGSRRISVGGFGMAPVLTIVNLATNPAV